VNSPAVVELYERETKLISDGLKARAKLLSQKLNTIPRVKCQEVEGAVFAFPRIELTESAIAAAKAKGLEPDVFYCAQVLENTGIRLLPGSTFKQREGTHHFRITNLLPNTEELNCVLETLKTYTQTFFATYP
jgi:aspartate/methionine/tyrosine aminotransferase